MLSWKKDFAKQDMAVLHYGVEDEANL
jgi:hypothetical protein